MTRTVAKLNINWPAEKQDVPPKSKLDKITAFTADTFELSLPIFSIVPEGPEAFHQASKTDIRSGHESLYSGRSGWRISAHHGGVTGIPG